MTLKLSSKEIRLRLSPGDIERLSLHPHISESIVIGDQTFSFQLEYKKEIKLSMAQFLKGQILISVPESDFLSWINNAEIEFEFELNDNLIVQVEKDLKPKRGA